MLSRHGYWRLLAGFCILSIILAGCLSTATAVHYRPGIYDGIGQGFRGNIRIRISLSESGLEDIQIIEHSEDSFAAFALEELLELALEMNSADIDAISGATISSRGFLTALEEALNKGIEAR